MKTSLHSVFLTSLSFLGAATLAFAATPAVDVMVANAAGKVVYRGKTSSDGTFQTPVLGAGQYVVQFNSKGGLKGGPFAIVVDAGKKKVVANSVSGGQFGKGGVAMRFEAGARAHLTGQLSSGSTASASSANMPDGERMEHGIRVKYEKGVKYVWVQNQLGTAISGRWVESGSAAAQNVVGVSRQDIDNLQNRNDHALPGGN